MKNILITGGAGYIGSHISEILVKNKKKIYIVDNLSTGYRSLINKKANRHNVQTLSLQNRKIYVMFANKPIIFDDPALNKKIQSL